MKRYFYDCPRGFSNEFSIYTVEMNDSYQRDLHYRRLKAWRESSNISWDLHQITRERAFQIIRTERAIKRTYLKAGLNLTCNPVGATEIVTIEDMYSGWFDV